MTHQIPVPSFPVTQERRYKLSPRPKKSFHTVLDAADMIDSSTDRTSLVRIETAPPSGAGESELVIRFEHPLKDGRIDEELRLAPTPDGLTTSRFLRSVYFADGRRVRNEEVDFAAGALPLPAATYPEVAVPFLVPWDPHDGKERAVFAWVCDRFVARIRYKSLSRKQVTVPAGTLDCMEFMMYPDLNDWVHLGRVITRMIRPFLPKYRIWAAPEPPFHIIRFEGSYGPPGAPEIVMELA